MPVFPYIVCKSPLQEERPLTKAGGARPGTPIPYSSTVRGPVLDVGPYTVSLMIHWFGKIRQVQGMFDIALPKRTDLKGGKFEVEI